MNATNKRKGRIAGLVTECKKMLKENFSETKLQECFITLKVAKAKGLLGAAKPRDCCLSETVNAANDILRVCKFESELDAALKNADSLYVYIGLVAINCITA